jgi:hypothetical protein
MIFLSRRHICCAVIGFRNPRSQGKCHFKFLVVHKSANHSSGTTQVKPKEYKNQNRKICKDNYSHTPCIGPAIIACLTAI